MDTPLFLVSLACAVVAPTLAIAYLRGILRRVLDGLCGADGSAEFWIRCATLLAVTGSVLTLMLFGEFDPGIPVALALRRCLFLTMAAVFASVAIISRNVWNQARTQASPPSARSTAEPQ
jgi:hypothetical protein